MKQSVKTILRELQTHANPKNVEGMARFGINPNNTLGLSIPFLRSLAKTIGKNHTLALDLWKSGIHEARILAAFIDIPTDVTEEQMERWVANFDSWDVCDQVCMNLFDRTPFAYKKAKEWANREKEFVRRAGFALMAVLAFHDKKVPDTKLISFFPLIKKYATDERNFVKKAVNWALRQIGKRNRNLNLATIKLAKEIEKISSKSAKWIAKDAIKELMVKNRQKRL